jgi:CDP-diacylglycerol--glycerol-3-phosphate 3-phosphatidyltransferase
MFTEWLRKVTRGIVEPIVTFLARIGIHANTLTILGCALNIAVAVVIALGHIRLGGILLIGASAFDALDGNLARRLHRPTKFGAFLDSVLDRVSEAAILLGIAWWYLHLGQPDVLGAFLAYVATVGSTMVSYARARGEGLGVLSKVGLLTRVERCVILIAGLVLNLVEPALWILAVGTVLTTIHRIIDTYVKLKDEPLTS